MTLASRLARGGTPAGALYEIRGRPTPQGTATFFRNLHGLLRSSLERFVKGQPWLSLEIAAIGHAVSYRLWIPDADRSLVENLLRGSYPELELLPAAHGALSLTHVGVAHIRLARGSYLPIRVQHDTDPLFSLLWSFTDVREGEALLLQTLVRPAGPGWQGHALLEAQRLRSGGRSLLTVSSGERRAMQFERDRAVLIERKSAGVGYDCVVRVAAGSDHSRDCVRKLIRSVTTPLSAFGEANSFAPQGTRFDDGARRAVERRTFPRFGSFILTDPELAGLWHLPTNEPPSLRRLRPMRLPPPAIAGPGQRVIGRSSWPGDDRRIGLSVADSRLHLHLLGPTGSGKTTAMQNLAVQDIAAGRGVAVLDPKGDLVAGILARIPPARFDDLVYLGATDSESCIGVNPLELGPEDDADLVAENILTIFKRLYARYWGMRTDDVLKVALRTLLARGNATLAHVPLLLTDESFRDEVTRDLGDPFLLEFWRWFASLSDGQRTEAVGPVLNKLRDFLVRPRLRRLLCQVRSTVRLEDVVDEGKILLADLSVGRWGESASELVGSFLMARLWQAVLARSALPEEERRDFFLYVDEFQRLQGTGSSFADALAQARSLRLSLTLANQNLDQLSDELRQAVGANARSKLVFQCGQADAAYLARSFAPLDASALESLPRYEMAARLALDGTTSQPFTIRTIAPEPVLVDASRLAKAASLAHYGRARESVDRELLSTLRWMTGKPSEGTE